jgi:hypothetical protein
MRKVLLYMFAHSLTVSAGQLLVMSADGNRTHKEQYKRAFE